MTQIGDGDGALGEMLLRIRSNYLLLAKQKAEMQGPVHERGVRIDIMKEPAERGSLSRVSGMVIIKRASSKGAQCQG